MDEAVREFLIESSEGLDTLEREMLALEQRPDSKDIIVRLFRAIHTIKGTAGCLGFGGIEALAHNGENLMSMLRDGALKLTPPMVAALLQMADRLRQLLASLEVDGKERTIDSTNLIATLGALAEPEAFPVQREAAPAPAAPAVVVAAAAVAVAVAAPVPIAVVIAVASPPAEVHAALAPVAAEVAPSPEPAEARAPAAADSSIRVDVVLLDKLMNLVGELVLARNQVMQFTGTKTDAALGAASQRLNQITTELQEGVMKTRMQPIGNIWQKFPRIVRDVAQGLGKHVRLELEGEHTELDKTLLEAIKDPLMHLLRNAIDHGIESPDKRAAKNKPAEGRIRLSAAHESGQVNIIIADDGGGIDVDRVREKALQRSFITADQASRMSERELVNLVFLAGFSTAEKVTNVSGRGVGMDVVRSNIEKIGGTVDIHTVAGEGTTFKIKIPLTLAIIPALIVTTGGDRYAIPQLSLLELVRLEGDAAKKGIERIGPNQGAPVYRLRGNLLPLVYLNRQLKLEQEAERDIVNIVVLQTDERQFGLVVDEINDTVEIVVKPLGKILKSLPIYAGATILGDGKVTLILDVHAVAQAANVVSQARESKLSMEADKAVADGEDQQTLLLCRNGADGRIAIPLSLVARLEEFEPKAIEQMGHQEVVQYRGRILPLVRMSQVLGGGDANVDPTSNLHVVVYSDGERSAGLVVDRILDIVKDKLAAKRPALRAGVLCAAVVQERVTEVLDVNGILRAVDPGFYAGQEGVA